MGAADVVPGFSGGTVALVAGVYERLVGNVRAGAGALALVARGRPRAAWSRMRSIDGAFLAALGTGIAVSIATLARGVEHLLETQPVVMSAVFLGLVLGASGVAVRLLRVPVPLHALLGAGAAVATFVMLGSSPGVLTDPAPLVVAATGAVAVSAMLLPGVSGSFLLLLLGMYPLIIGAVADRDLAVLAVFGAGMLVGLAAFSTLLDWLLRRAHDAVLAVLIGLMLGSARVLWPWPSGSGVGDPALAAPGPDWPIVTAAGVSAAMAVGLLAWGARTAEARATGRAAG
jgi:putative membrane protein